MVYNACSINYSFYLYTVLLNSSYTIHLQTVVHKSAIHCRAQNKYLKLVGHLIGNSNITTDCQWLSHRECTLNLSHTVTQFTEGSHMPASTRQMVATSLNEPEA